MRYLLPVFVCWMLTACQDDHTVINADCPETGNCDITLPNGETITLDLKGELTPLTPIDLEMRTSTPINQTRVVFTGIDMNMGVLPFDLDKTETGAKGVGRVATCIEPRMAWQAQYQFELQGHMYHVNRQFVVEQIKE